MSTLVKQGTLRIEIWRKKVGAQPILIRHDIYMILCPRSSASTSTSNDSMICKFSFLSCDVHPVVFFFLFSLAQLSQNLIQREQQFNVTLIWDIIPAEFRRKLVFCLSGRQPFWCVGISSNSAKASLLIPSLLSVQPINKSAGGGGAPQASYDKQRHRNCFQTRPLQAFPKKVNISRSWGQRSVDAITGLHRPQKKHSRAPRSEFTPELHRFDFKVDHQEIFWSP